MSGEVDLDGAIERLKGSIEKMLKQDDQYLTALREIRDRCDGYEDITDNGGPNLAMQILTIVRSVL